MVKSIADSNLSKSKGQIVFEYILLVVLLCVIALRTTYTESPYPQPASRLINLYDNIYSLSISGVLIFSFILWLVWNFCIGSRIYRYTSIEIGLCIFIFAAIIAGFAASNKRVATSNFAVFIASPVCAILLIQLLDSRVKVKLLLIVIATLGLVSAYECVNQLLITNKAMIAQYQQDPESLLEPLGISAGSLQHWLFEHRLYSKDIKGFFTTSNSAGSFALLASFAAIAIFIERFKSRRSSQVRQKGLFICGIATIAVFLGLIITQSKGAIAALIIAAVMFITYILFGSWLKNHKKTIFISLILAFVFGGCVVIWYGLTHDRLPGGNSMLVRWQYWLASAKIYASQPLTGIGPGNFQHYYTHYKIPSALETVSDPHNFLLSIITQYGPVGLIGFLIMVLLPLQRAISKEPAFTPMETYPPKSSFEKPAIWFLIIISTCLLIIRPMIIAFPSDGNTFFVIVYGIFALYIAPPTAFAVAFWLFTKNAKPVKKTNDSLKAQITNLTIGALFCGCLGVLLHNLIDFAIFEPGVFTTFWAVIACLIALDFQRYKQGRLVVPKRPLFAKIFVAGTGMLIIWAYLGYCLIPVAKSNWKIARAHQAISNNELEKAHKLLTAASNDDHLSPDAPSLNGRLYLQRARTCESQTDLLLKAKKCFSEAVDRNNADFKNFERLAKVYTLLAENQKEKKQKWLDKAFANVTSAIERYPGSGRLRLQLGEIAEQLGKTNVAIEQYKKAIDIEDSFRRQFQFMYPNYKVVSRLGEEKYQLAKQRIKELSK